jgi:hypothetical protein
MTPLGTLAHDFVAALKLVVAAIRSGQRGLRGNKSFGEGE